MPARCVRPIVSRRVTPAQRPLTLHSRSSVAFCPAAETLFICTAQQIEGYSATGRRMGAVELPQPCVALAASPRASLLYIMVGTSLLTLHADCLLPMVHRPLPRVPQVAHMVTIGDDITVLADGERITIPVPADADRADEWGMSAVGSPVLQQPMVCTDIPRVGTIITRRVGPVPATHSTPPLQTLRPDVTAATTSPDPVTAATAQGTIAAVGHFSGNVDFIGVTKECRLSRAFPVPCPQPPPAPRRAKFLAGRYQRMCHELDELAESVADPIVVRRLVGGLEYVMDPLPTLQWDLRRPGDESTREKSHTVFAATLDALGPVDDALPTSRVASSRRKHFTTGVLADKMARTSSNRRVRELLERSRPYQERLIENKFRRQRRK